MITLSRIAAALTSLVAVAVGAYVLFGPTYTRCSFGTIGQTGIGQPVVTLEPERCDTASLVATQPVWPMPLLAIIFWSTTPLLALAGAWLRRPSLALAGLLLELTALISFGVGPYYVPFVALPMALTWLLIARADAERPNRVSAS